MKIEAMVYTSNTGFAERYAKMLGPIKNGGDYVKEENLAGVIALIKHN